MPDPDAVGLCGTCVNCRRVVSDRGSFFYRCGLHDTDPRFPKYPSLPLLACSGYVRLPAAQVGE